MLHTPLLPRLPTVMGVAGCFGNESSQGGCKRITICRLDNTQVPATIPPQPDSNPSRLQDERDRIEALNATYGPFSTLDELFSHPIVYADYVIGRWLAWD